MKKLSFMILSLCVISIKVMAQTENVFPKDTYWTSPQKPYVDRRELYLNFCAANNNDGSRDGVFSQVARLELGLPVNENAVRGTIAVVGENKDCNDFSVGGLVRLLYLDQNKHRLSEKLRDELEACLTNFKYWWDEPEKDAQYRCYHTENHQGLYHQDELMAGQLFKKKLFKDGRTGAYHINHAKLLLDKWLSYRVRFGYSEWLSNNYLEVDLLTLSNLYDFAEDHDIRDRAGLLIDMTLYEMALNNFHGVFGSTHGRTYNRSLTGGRQEATSSISKLMFGAGIFNSPRSLGAVSLATSSYRCPSVIENIANDYGQTIDHKERQSINIDDAPRYGLSYNNELDCHLYWGMQEFINPDVIAMSKRISEKYDVWPYRDYQHYEQLYADQRKQFGKIVNPNLDRYALSEANIQTYRTRDYMLSSVQRYRPGTPGYQQHVWQATLGTDAVVFLNNPGESTPEPTGKESSPAYWAGNKILPDAAQYKNVLFCIYNNNASDHQTYSHAYFPKSAFDEVVEKGNWTFGRKGDAFIALYSQNTTNWVTSSNGEQNELRSASPQNSWICEMGSRSQWGSFDSFVNKISSGKVKCDALNICYNSPSAGSLKFGWKQPLSVNNKQLALTGYPRFENLYGKTEFASDRLAIKYKNQTLVLDFNKNKREIR
ncbi:MAG: hypothetical protein JWR38_3396 [Mucilaginibacter sp.]|nr:hypothetical protein [Mucilaginibacter sp.]